MGQPSNKRKTHIARSIGPTLEKKKSKTITQDPNLIHEEKNLSETIGFKTKITFNKKGKGNLKILPSPPNTGISFVRTDLKKNNISFKIFLI